MRGGVHRLRAPRDVVGHEQRGPRFAVVVQASRLAHMSTWVVVPTSASGDVRARAGLLHPALAFGYGECVALVDQVRAVDAHARLGELVGYVDVAQMQEIDRALTFILDL